MASSSSSDIAVEEKADHVKTTSLELKRGSISHGQVFDENEEVEVGWRTWMAALSGASCVFSGYYTGLLLGNTAVVVTSAFDHPELATWMPNEFAIILAASGGLVGSCSDKVGRKNILLGGIALAMIGTILIAAAQNIAMVLVGAGMTAGIFANQGNFFSIPAEVLPRRYRGMGATLTVSAGGFGALLGLMFSAATIESTGLGWRSTWILASCIHGLAMLMLILFYRPLESPKEPGVATWKLLRETIDWVGAFFLAAGLGLIMIGMTMGGTVYPWTSPQVIGVLCGGAGSLIVLAIHQVFFNKHGILDHDLWTRNFCVASFGCFVEGIVFYSILLFFPLMTETLWESRPFYINVRLLAFFVTSAVVAPFVGWYTRWSKDLKYPLLVGWVFVLVGFIILTTATKSSNYTSIGGLFLVGIGFATPLALLFAIAQLATAPHLLGLTTGQLISARGVGQTVGASVLVAIFKAKISTILPTYVSKAAVEAGLPHSSVAVFVEGIAAGNATITKSAPGVTQAIIEAGETAATAAYIRSFHLGWTSALPFAIVALLLVFLLDGKKIKTQMTWLVERPVAKIHHVERDAT